jgi:hypothetical protein
MAVSARYDYVGVGEKVYPREAGKGERGMGKATGKLTADFFTFPLYPFTQKI